jgi:hypothetical protein
MTSMFQQLYKARFFRSDPYPVEYGRIACHERARAEARSEDRRLLRVTGACLILCDKGCEHRQGGSHMVLKDGKVPHRQLDLASFGIVVIGLIVLFTGCANALYSEAEAIRFEATAQTRIPVAPKTPNVSPIDGPEGSGKVLVAWNAVPGTTAYDVVLQFHCQPTCITQWGN